MKIVHSGEYFNPTDTLECGQIFRFTKKGDGYLVFSADKACYIYSEGKSTIIECEESDVDYFSNYFDLATDYSTITAKACESGYDILKKSAMLGKGVRILRQQSEEMLYSFMISQNNNIPRIKGIINKLCVALGEEKSFLGEPYFAFPTTKALLKKDESFYKECGLGYRSAYVKPLAESIDNGLIEALLGLNGAQVKGELLKIKGIGEKVADCARLFGFYKTDSFPVDTWIEKIYREDFNGLLTDRKKITAFFEGEFGEYSGYFQQYLFYYKRTLQSK